MNPDRILSRETLFTARAVARQARVRGASRTVELDGGPKLVVRSGAVVRLEAPHPDLSRFNTLTVAVRPLSRFKCTLVTTLRHRTRAPGMTEDDSSVSVDHFHQPCPWTGWTKVVLPAENLVATGIPDGWKNVAAVELRFNSRYDGGEIALGDIGLCAVEKPAGSRMSDEELFTRALDLERPDLQPVARHVAAGRLDRAVTALAAVVRRRKPLDAGPRTWNRHFGSDSAGQILRGHIMGQSLGSGEFDWRINPIGYLEWNHAFNRHTWITELTDAVLAARGRERVRRARGLDRLMAGWIRQCPEPAGHSGGLDPAWETLSTSCRINWAWPNVLAAAAVSRAFTDRTLVEMLKSIHGHAEHLLRYHGDCNWFVSESTAIITCAALAPFFRRAGHWAAEARRRLEKEMRRQVFPDGAQFELSPGYHMMCADLFLRGWRNGAVYGAAFSPAYVRRLAALFDYRLLLSRPNGTIPVPNDAGCNHSDGPREPQASLAWAARLLRRPEWAWIPGARHSPGTLSVHFPDAGHAILRSGWDRRARWAFMDAAQLGAAHQHEDKLHVELHAYGATFLIDAGIQSYQHDPLVAYCRRADAHNTIRVDGCQQNRRAGGDYRVFEASSRGNNFWASGRGLDVFTGVYDEAFSPFDRLPGGRAGRGRAPNGIAHSRTLVFVKDDYWLILDRVTGAGRHRLEALWHFAPMHLKIDRGAHLFRTHRVGLANLELICRGGWSDARLRMVTGQNDPPQGFIAIDGEMKPAPCAIVDAKASLPFHGVSLAAPYESGTASGLDVTCRDLRGPGPGTTGLLIEVTGRGHHDRILWRHTGAGRISSDAMAGDGALAITRHDDAGRPFYAAVCDGTALRFDSFLVRGKPGGLREWVPSRRSDRVR